jgi:hypothetical protein
VNFDGDARLIGRFVDVRITEALPNSLRGRLVAVRDAEPLLERRQPGMSPTRMPALEAQPVERDSNSTR